MRFRPRPLLTLLKEKVTATGSCFFERSSMRFFGDTMANYKVSGPTDIEGYDGSVTPCWVLERKRPVKHGLVSDAYFSCATFERVFARKDAR